MNYHWDWGVLFRSPYFVWILSGFGLTCLISVLAWGIALVVDIGTPLTSLRLQALSPLDRTHLRSALDCL